MKRRTAAEVGLLLAACLMATSAAAKPKLRSIDALARALAAKLPHTPGLVVYVAWPTWEGLKEHVPVRKKIRDELASALTAADSTANVLTPANVKAALAKHGLQPLDVYCVGGDSVASFVRSWAGTAAVAITSEIREEKGTLDLTVGAVETRRNKRIAKLSALITESPKLQALLSLPDAPIKDDAGVYLPGAGVGYPRCVQCEGPVFPPQALRRWYYGSILLAFTVGTDGKVSKIDLLRGLTGRRGPELNQVAIRAVRLWQFQPAQGPNGKPVATRMEVMFRFHTVP